MIIGSVLCFSLAATVYGHGRLQIPKTRFHAKNGYDGYENDPVNFGTEFAATSYEKFVCRHDPPMSPDGGLKDPETQLTAGENMDVKWLMSAAHVGDCAMYVSYDYDKKGEDKKNMKWFKIANWQECKMKTNQMHQIKVPSWLPGGRAVFRWDWYALHQRAVGSIEFYAQCADVMVTAGGGSLAVADVPSYSVMGLYPETAHAVFEDWRVGLPAGIELWMTGPPCACRMSNDNGCKWTQSEAMTNGYISRATIPSSTLAVCGDSPPPPAPTPAVSTVTPKPTIQGTQAPTQDDNGCVAVWGKCGGKDYMGETCCTAGNMCNHQSEWYAQCIPDSGEGYEAVKHMGMLHMSFADTWQRSVDSLRSISQSVVSGDSAQKWVSVAIVAGLFVLVAAIVKARKVNNSSQGLLADRYIAV